MRTGKMPVLAFAGIAALAVTTNGVQAEGWLRRLCPAWMRPAEPEILPLVIPSQQTSPATPPTTTKPPTAPPVAPKPPDPTPSTPSPAVPPGETEPRFEPLVSAALGESSVAVAAHYANMHGDQFVTGRGRSYFTTIVPGPTSVFNGSVTFPNAQRNPPANSPFLPVAPFQVGSNPAIFNGIVVPGPITLPLSPTTIVQQVAAPPPLVTTAPFISSPQIQTLVSPLANPGGAIFVLAQANNPNQVTSTTIAVGANGQAINYVEGNYQTVPTPDVADLQYPLTLSVQTQRPVTTFIDLPNPSGGGVVGRAKISEDANPLPRDRIIFNYDYFNDAALTAYGLDVHRYVVGFEKTFLDRMGSVEVRLPFASTMNSTFGVGQESRDTELGNLRLVVRLLLYGSETFNVGTGLGAHLPTSADTRLQLTPGVDFIRIENQSVVLTPYIAAIFTPNNRAFVQTWFAFDFDTAGNPVYANLGNGLVGLGRIQDTTLLQTDIQAGYWVYKAEDRDRRIQGLAPFVEMHYGTTVQNPDSVQSNGLYVGDLTGRHDELNLVAGVISQVGERLLVTLGGVAPLRGNDDRGFDYQIGVRVNYFFGPTPASQGPRYVVP